MLLSELLERHARDAKEVYQRGYDEGFKACERISPGMINIHSLTLADIGKWVVYTRSGTNHKELGRIKSMTNETIFVVYNCGREWERFQDFTAASTNPRDLQWVL